MWYNIAQYKWWCFAVGERSVSRTTCSGACEVDAFLIRHQLARNNYWYFERGYNDVRAAVYRFWLVSYICYDDVAFIVLRFDDVCLHLGSGVICGAFQALFTYKLHWLTKITNVLFQIRRSNKKSMLSNGWSHRLYLGNTKLNFNCWILINWITLFNSMIDWRKPEFTHKSMEA